MSDVQVSFGASIDQLVEGVKGAKESIDSLRESAAHLLELLGVKLTFDGIKDFIESMGALGLQTERIQAQLGLSREEVGEFAGLAKLTGTDVEGLTNSLARLGLNVQRSAKDAFSPAAQGLQAIGLRAKDLIGVPADQYLDRLHDAVSRFNASLQLTDAVMAIGGRGVAQIIPLLQVSAERWKELKEEIARAQEGLADAIPGMAESHEKLTLLGISVQSLGARIFTVLKPGIDAAVEAITKWVQSLDSDTIRNAVNTIGNVTISVAQSIALFFVSAKESWDKFISTLQSGMPVLHAAAAGALIIMGQANASAVEARKALEGGGVGESFTLIEERAEGARKAINDFAAAARDKLNAAVPKAGTWEAAAQDMAHLNSEVQEVGRSFLKLNAPGMNLGGKEQLQAQIEYYQTAIKLRDDYYASSVERINALAKAGKIGESQKTADLKAAVDARENEEVGTLTRELSIGNLSVTQRRKIEDEISLIHAKAEKDRQKITDDAMVANTKAWENTIKPIQSAWDSQLKGLLSGTTTFAQAMRNIVGDLVLDLIKKFEELAIVKPLINGLSDAINLSSLGSSVLKMITSMAGPIFAGVTANVAPETGPAAPAVGASVAAGALATAKGLSQLDVGTWNVPRDMPAMVHQGEMVVPRFDSDLFRSAVGGGGGGGGVTHNWNISAVDARSFTQMLNNNSSALSKAITQAMRNNALKPATA